MRKKSLTLVGLLLLIPTTVGFCAVLYDALHPAEENEIEIAQEMAPGPGVLPSKLVIPRLEIKGDIQKVGINIHGNVSAPASYYTIGWYKLGPKPGAAGISLLDGHVNNGLGLNGVFADLDKIQKGDKIEILSADGSTLHFTVYATSTLDYTSRLSDLTPLHKGEGSEIALMTCEGHWVQASKTYDKRIVVLAKLTNA
jgi:sortase A